MTNSGPASILLINPNTSAGVTANLLRHAARHIAATQARFEGLTAAFGAPYISDEVGFAVASHAALDAWAEYQKTLPTRPAQAILVACFGDPGLMALRACAGVPVTGLAEASFRKASGFGRFTIVTGGKAWAPMLARLAWALGFGPDLSGIHTVTATGQQLAQDPEAAVMLLRQACHEALARHPADALILGGAGLAGMAASIQEDLPVPLIDSVLAGIDAAVALASQVHEAMDTPQIELTGVSPALQAQFARPLRA